MHQPGRKRYGTQDRVNSTYVENYDCGLLQPLYGTHGGAPPSPDMFGVTMQKNWSKMRSSHMICNVLNTVPGNCRKRSSAWYPGSVWTILPKPSHRRAPMVSGDVVPGVELPGMGCTIHESRY